MLSSPSLSVVSFQFLRSSILCNVCSSSPSPLVSGVFWHELFLALHGIAHPGVQAYCHLIYSRFVWPGVAKDISLWARTCLCCQQSKVQTHIHFPVPSFYFDIGFKIPCLRPRLVRGLFHTRHITSFHPQSNGMIEKFHHSLGMPGKGRLGSASTSGYAWPLLCSKRYSGFSPA